jgi:TfoX/Sxy family transcriptional regulator of competence genes
VDEALRARVREALAEVEGITEKPMVGGTGFLLRGNLLCGVIGEDLLVRTGKQDFERHLTDPAARPMTMGGRSSRSWILVDGAAVAGEDELARWIGRALDFVATLPAR